ncbi:hypothetical protein [Coralloluteibacterium thermophilus]|uniref:Prepilin-type cleavage/methylation domain-containing protein n=1 Tax=Coralloluteibacterium thermophilum TaxID=2707049 RepID=A0ABV9NM88_9GAMM
MSTCCDRLRRQRGDILLDALIGVLVAALVGGGIAHLTARIMDSQRQARVSQIALVELRNALLDEGLSLCGTALPLSLPDGPAAEVECAAAAPLTLSIGGAGYTVTPPAAIVIEADAEALGLGTGGGADPPLTLGTRQ